MSADQGDRGPSWRIYRAHVAVAWSSEEVKVSRKARPDVVTACHAVLTARGYGRPDSRASLTSIDEGTAHLLWELISGHSRREDLLRDLVAAMPGHPEAFWQAVGYDPGNHFPGEDSLEPLRAETAALLARLRDALPSGLQERLEDPPGPLCAWCSELLLRDKAGKLLRRDGFCDAQCAQDAEREGGA